MEGGVMEDGGIGRILIGQDGNGGDPVVLVNTTGGVTMLHFITRSTKKYIFFFMTIDYYRFFSFQA